MELNISNGTITSTAMSTGPQKQFKNPNDVEFVVKYPEGYQGPKHMPEGIVTVSKESAEQFTKMGIGKVAEGESESTENKSTGTEGGAAKVEPLKANELIAKINEASTVEDVDALIQENEKRTTVLAAAEARKKELSEGPQQ